MLHRLLRKLVPDRLVSGWHRLQERTVLRRILGNTSWLMLERFVNLTVRFFVGVWVVRYLGPDQFGVYSYALSFVALFTVFAGLGLDRIVVRELANEEAVSDALLSTAFLLRLAGAVGGYALIVGTVEWVEDDPLTREAVWIMGVQLLFLAFNAFDYWFQAQVRSKHVVLARSAATVLFSGGQVVAILLGAPMLVFAWLFLGYTALSALGIGLSFWKLGPDRFTWQPQMQVARRYMRDAWPLIISGLSTAAYMRIDQVMLGQMLDDTAVGIYAAAVKLSELWYFVPMAVSTSVFPEIVRIRSRQTPAVYRQRMQLFYDHMGLLGYGIALGMSVIAVPLIGWLFGPAYAPAGPILQVHLWAIVFLTLGIARANWLIAENLTGFTMLTSILGAVANIGLNLYLIPRWEGLGAAWATLIAQAVASYLTCVLSSDTRPAFVQMTKALFYPIRLLAALRPASTGRP